MSTTILPEVQQIMDDREERELWIVGKEHERPPYFFPDEGMGNRLGRALRVVSEGRCTPHSDGSYTVEGSEGRTYRVTDSCSCPNSQKGKSKWCYHAVAVALYIEWRTRCASLTGQPALPLPPSTPDARLAQPPALPTRCAACGQPDSEQAYLGHLACGHVVCTRCHRDQCPCCVPQTPGEDAGTNPDAGTRRGDPDPVSASPRPRVAASAPSLTPQEAPMTEDPDPYIPEPAVAVLEPPVAEPVPLRIPKEYTVSIKGRTHVLYTGLVLVARSQGLMTLSADWTYNDADLSLAHAVCTFADGRRYEDSGDATPSNVSKGIASHFRRVALTRAKARCLRDALGISECSVEELEDDAHRRETPDLSAAVPPPTTPTTQDLRSQIWAIVKGRAPQTVGSREAVAAWVQQQTGYALVPANYGAIVHSLETREG